MTLSKTKGQGLVLVSKVTSRVCNSKFVYWQRKTAGLKELQQTLQAFDPKKGISKSMPLNILNRIRLPALGFETDYAIRAIDLYRKKVKCRPIQVAHLELESNSKILRFQHLHEQYLCLWFLILPQKSTDVLHWRRKNWNIKNAIAIKLWVNVAKLLSSQEASKNKNIYSLRMGIIVLSLWVWGYEPSVHSLQRSKPEYRKLAIGFRKLKFYLVSYMGDHDSKNYKSHEKSNSELIKTSKGNNPQTRRRQDIKCKARDVELHLWRS